MFATIAVAAIGYQQIQTVNNGHEVTPESDYAQVKEVAKELDITIYAPDRSLKGYNLRAIEYAKVPVNDSFPGLQKRIAIRLSYLNKVTYNTLEIIQLPSSELVNSTSHTKWVFNGRFFDTSLVSGHSYVASKRGATDVALHGGLISESSAKIVLEKMVAVTPN